MDAEIQATIAGQGRYSDETAFVRADMDGLGLVLDRYMRAGQTVVLVYADGHQRVIHSERAVTLRHRVFGRLAKLRP